MNKTKFLVALLIVPLLISACSCQRNGSEDRTDFEVKQTEDVQSKVKDWVVYTNPAYRYELRSPLDWQIEDVEKKGEEVMFFPKGKELSDNYKGELRILGYSNWKEKYKLDYYVKYVGTTNYYALTDAKDKEVIEFRGFYAEHLKNVELGENIQGDVILIDARDRIIIIELRGSFDKLSDIIGSMYFY